MLHVVELYVAVWYIKATAKNWITWDSTREVHYEMYRQLWLVATRTGLVSHLTKAVTFKLNL